VSIEKENEMSVRLKNLKKPSLTNNQPRRKEKSVQELTLEDLELVSGGRAIVLLQN